MTIISVISAPGADGKGTIADQPMEAATVRKVPYDLKLRIIGGGGSDGALGIADLQALVQFIQGAASQDPSLANLSLVDVTTGSRVALLRAEPHLGLPGLLSPTDVIAEIFDKKKHGKKGPVELPHGVLKAFKTWTRGGAKVEVTYCPGKALRPQKVTFDHMSLTSAKTKPVETFGERTITGKLVRLHSDEDLFGVKTNQGVLHCPFPEHEKESWVALYERTVSVKVKAPPQPSSGHRWRASETLEIVVLPDPPSLDFGQNIPGLVPPKFAREGGFSLEDLFPGLDPEDADSLADSLKKYREH